MADAAYYQKNRERILANVKARYLAKREEIRAYKRRYQVENRERLAAKKHSAYVLNRDVERVKHRARYVANAERRKAAVKAYRDANKKKAQACTQAWCERNRARLNAVKGAWQKAHPLVAINRSARRRARERNARVGRIDYKKVLAASNGRCGICGEPFDQMDYHFDHIVPLSIGGAHTQNNLQVAHPGCNLKKGARVA
jgi:5-methylcytosine-specific restriction endonuclease McrA